MTKLAISNIAWDGCDYSILELASRMGVKGVEVAPRKLGSSWSEVNVKKIIEYRKLCRSFGLVVPSFQAFMYGKPELQFFGDDKIFNRFKDHISFTCELAVSAGAKLLVFGAPKNRIKGSLDHKTVRELELVRFNDLADICSKFDINLGLEAVPSSYGCDYLTSYKESLHVVKSLNHSNLVFHLDVACTEMNGDRISDAISEGGEHIRHFHVSQTNLNNFDAPELYHKPASDMLKRVGYKGWVSIEMLNKENSLASIERAIKYVSDMYMIK